MTTAQNLNDTHRQHSGGELTSWSDGKMLNIPDSLAWQSLSDCHADSHMLVGTHSGGGSNQSPLCLTCQFRMT